MAPSFDDGNSLFNFVVRDGNGVKGIVDSGISKVPDQYIQPPYERINKLEAGKFEHPPIDMLELDAPNCRHVTKEIVNAAKTLGFFQVVNHGMSIELLESLKDAAHKFFAQPPKKKAVYRKGVSPTSLVRYGTSFVPEKENALEWKDYIGMVYTSDDDAFKSWPQECKEVALEYMRGSVKLVKKLLEVLIGNLGVILDESRVNGLIGSKLILSHGKYMSVEHRVLTTNTQSRVSIPVFTAPAPMEKIAPLPELVKSDGRAHNREIVFQDYMNNFLEMLTKERSLLTLQKLFDYVL